MNDINPIPLGAIPLYCSPKHRIPTSQELAHISQLKYIPTIGLNNFITDSKYALEASELSELKSFCYAALQDLTKRILRIQQPFRITNSWCTLNPAGAEHRAHEHRNSIFSGVYYVTAPSGNITFYYKNGYSTYMNFQYGLEDHNLWNREAYTLTPSSGMLIIFPSSLHHEVEPNESNEDRRVVAFNTFVSGDFGSDMVVDKLCIPQANS